ncbi:MAG: endonuclease/exonuclease/phosphatase family protein [Carboxylicivirga sp.]|nr:endonuclease/exonuclease/phosphatase family protein [Carboxylicivirga sp.]
MIEKFKFNDLSTFFLISIFFLFFLQQLALFIEGIYSLSLIHLSPGATIFSLVLLYIPAILPFIKHNNFNYALIGSLMLISVVFSYFLPLPFVIYSSGLYTGLFLLFVALQANDRRMSTIAWGEAIGLATLASIAFRSVGNSIDITLVGKTNILGLSLVLLASNLLLNLVRHYSTNEKSRIPVNNICKNKAAVLNVLGFFACILFIYIAFSSPGVLARWTESDYFYIHLTLCLVIFVFLAYGSSKLFFYKGIRILLIIWNVAFILVFIGNIVLSQVEFPATPNSSSVYVGEPTIISEVFTYLMIMLAPIIFININLFSYSLKSCQSSKLTISFIIGSSIIIISVFMMIYTNTWGYAKPYSTFLRNQFHLPFIIIGILMVIPVCTIKIRCLNMIKNENYYWIRTGGAIIFIVIALSPFVFAYFKKDNIQKSFSNRLTLMTYNIQQGIDMHGNNNFEGQLTLIKKINPDIIALQESDRSRISGGNSDVVRYFENNLGYYSYYGPNTISGTFGTAILSRFPLHSCQTIYSYSTDDEIGTAITSINVNGKEIIISNSHPNGTEDARRAHIKEVIEIASNNKSIVALGDYNFNQKSNYYKEITKHLNDAWLSVYPDASVDIESLKATFYYPWLLEYEGIANGKLNMSSRIDHILVSDEFQVLEAHYLPEPMSGTDHPAHWVVVGWDENENK